MHWPSPFPISVFCSRWACCSNRKSDWLTANPGRTNFRSKVSQQFRIMSNQMCDSPRHVVSHDVYLNGLRELKASRTNWTSEKFQCPSDPDGSEWTLRLKFGSETPDYLGLFLINSSNRPIFLHEGHLTLYGSDGKEIYSDFLSSFKIPQGQEWGFKSFCTLQRLPEAEHCVYDHQIKVQCRFSYGGKFGSHPLETTPAPKKVDPGLHDDYAALLDSGDGADVTFKVGQVDVKAVRAILTARSKYFKGMFESGMKESSGTVIPIKDVDAAIFKELLKYLYCGKLPQNFDELVPKLLAAADRFQVSSLKDACEAHLINSLTSHSICEVTVLAYAHSCADLLKKCLRYIKEHLGELKTEPEWKEMMKCPGLAIEVLEFDAYGVGVAKKAETA